MNLSIEKKQTHGLGKQICVCQGGGEGIGMDWEFGVAAFGVDKQWDPAV